MEQNDLDRNLDFDLYSDLEDVPVYTGHSLFNTTKRITLLFIVYSLLQRNPAIKVHIWPPYMYSTKHLYYLQ